MVPLLSTTEDVASRLLGRILEEPKISLITKLWKFMKGKEVLNRLGLKIETATHTAAEAVTLPSSI